MSGSIKVMLEIGMPQVQANPQSQSEYKESVEDKVRSALECIESGYDSSMEWSMINRLYRDLCKLKKPSERALNLLKMIEPILAKYGYFEVTNREA